MYYNILKYLKLLKQYIVYSIQFYIKFEGVSSYMSTAIAEVVEFIGELFGSLSCLVERAVVQRITVTACYSSRLFDELTDKHEVYKARPDESFFCYGPTAKSISEGGDRWRCLHCRSGSAPWVMCSSCLHLSVFRVFLVCKCLQVPRPKHLWPSKTLHCVWCVLVWKWPFECTSKAVSGQCSCFLRSADQRRGTVAKHQCLLPRNAKSSS